MGNLDTEKSELQIQKDIAFAAGFLQGDITIKTLLESLAEGLVIVNSSGRIVLINERMEALTGYGKMEVMGQPLSVFVPDHARSKHDHFLKQFFSAPKIRPMGKGVELVARRKDNSTFPTEISLSYLETEIGLLGIAFLTDITLRKQAENELKQRNLELDAYAHTVAHDLSSSLVTLSGNCGILLDETEKLSAEEQVRCLREISRTSSKMSNIIKELLLFSRTEKSGVEIKKIDIKGNIKSACERLQLQIQHKSAIISIQENISDCLGYAPWVEEIWFNYIHNALKYGGVPPVIEIGSIRHENGTVEYFVSDNGGGVDKTLLGVLFEESNAQKDKLKAGSGIGLSIVRRIIDKLGGSVSVSSEPGKGSRFCFTLQEAP